MNNYKFIKMEQIREKEPLGCAIKNRQEEDLGRRQLWYHEYKTSVIEKVKSLANDLLLLKTFNEHLYQSLISSQGQGP